MSIHPFQTKSKFAMLTVNNVYTDLPAAAFQLSDGTWVMPAVPVPDLGIWKEWIGSIRMERVGRANLVFFVEEPSDNLEILDAVHHRLDKDLSLLFYMLHLHAGIEVADGADLLCGSSVNGVPGIRQMSQMPAFHQSKGWKRGPKPRLGSKRASFCVRVSQRWTPTRPSSGGPFAGFVNLGSQLTDSFHEQRPISLPRTPLPAGNHRLRRMGLSSLLTELP